MFNKRLIIDLGSQKTRKIIIICFAAVLVLIVSLVYFTMSKDDPDSPELENQISTSDSGIQEPGTTAGSIYVDVSGAVKNPSVILLAEGSRVFEAIEAAGGLTEDANIIDINRAEVLDDGAYLYIPTNKEVEDNSVPALGTGAGSSGVSNSVNSAGKININTADSATLQELNGVGPATAEKIIAYRSSNGKFGNIEEIKNVSGIGDKTYEKLAPNITV